MQTARQGRADAGNSMMWQSRVSQKIRAFVKAESVVFVNVLILRRFPTPSGGLSSNPKGDFCAPTRLSLAQASGHRFA